MSFTLCTSGSAVQRAGLHVNADIKVSGSFLAKAYDHAEGWIEAETRRSWVANHATLSTGMQGMLSNVASALMADDLVSYDTTGYLTSELDTIMNKNHRITQTGLKILKDFKSNTIQEP